MSLGTSAAKGGALTLGTQFLRVVINLGLTVVLARLLSPHDFGLVAMVVSLVGVAEILRDFGLSTAAVQAKHLSAQQRTNLFWVNATIGSVCAIAIALLAPLIAVFYGQPALADVARAVSVVFFLNGLATQFKAEINRSLRFASLNSTELVPQFLGAVIAVITALLGAEYWAIVMQQISAAFFSLVMVVVMSRWFPGLPKQTPGMKPLLTFGMTLTGVQTLGYITRNADNVALGRVWGASVLGLYDRAYQLLMAPINQINAPLTRVAVPVLARLQDDLPRYERFLSRAQLLACYVTVSIFALCSALAFPIVEVLFGPNWLGAAPILAILALGGVFRSLMQVTYWIYLSRGLTGVQLRFDLIAQPALIGVILCGLPWGVLGVAIGHSIGYALYWLFGLIWVGRKSGVNVRPLFENATRATLLVAAPAGISAWSVSSLFDGAFVELAVGLATFAAVATIATLVFPRVRRDLRLLFETLSLAFSRKVGE